MTLASAIYSQLTGDSAIAALVGTRVYPVTGPQQDDNAAISPMIVYALIARQHEYTIGAKALTLDTWTFVSVAADYDTAHQVNDALTACLDRYRGAMPSVSGVQIQTVTLGNSQDVEDEFELGIFQVRTEFDFVY